MRRRPVTTMAVAILALALAACGGATAPTAPPTAEPSASATAIEASAPPASVAPVADVPSSATPGASPAPVCIDAGDGGAPVCGRQAAVIFGFRDEIPTSTGRDAAGGVKKVCIEADLADGGTDPKLALAPVGGAAVPIPVGRQVCVGGAGGAPLGDATVELQPVGTAPGAQCGSCWAFSVIDPSTVRVTWLSEQGFIRTTDVVAGEKTTIEPGGRPTLVWIMALPGGVLMLCVAGG